MKIQRKPLLQTHHGPVSDVFSLPLPAVSHLTRSATRFLDRLVEITCADAVSRPLSIPIDTEAFSRTGFISMPRIINITCALCGTTHHTLWEIKMIASAGRCSHCIDETRDDKTVLRRPDHSQRRSADSI